MMKTLRNALVLGLSLLLLTVMTVCPIHAGSARSSDAAEPAFPKTLLALGDSLTTGYGLDNYVPGGDPYRCASYINTVAEAMGLVAGETYVNRAVNGDTTGDLASLLPRIEEEVKAAEMIVISIGGNDFLDLLPEIASHLVGEDVTRLEDVADALLNVSEEAIAELAGSSWFLTKIAVTLTKLNNNLSTITSYLNNTAPHARVIFLQQFNPLVKVPGLSDFGDFAQPFLDNLNTALKKACATYGYETVDIPSVINCDAAGLTNILEYDIHPNAKGHLEMAKLLASYLEVDLKLPEETGDAEETTAAEPEETVAISEETTGFAPETAAPSVETMDSGSAADTSLNETGLSSEGTDTSAPSSGSSCTASAAGAALLLTSVCAAYVLRKKRES